MVYVLAYASARTALDEPGISDAASAASAVGVFSFLYYWIPVGVWGLTLGKLLVGVRVRQAADGERAGFLRALVRVVATSVLGVLVLTALVNYLWPFWDERKQTLHDKIAGTIVIRDRY